MFWPSSTFCLALFPSTESASSRLPTLRTRNERADSCVRCQSRPSGLTSKGAMPLPFMVSSRSVRKSSFCDVLSTMGRDRLMCNGCGVPRSEVRNEFMAGDGTVDESEVWRRASSVLKMRRSWSVGCPGVELVTCFTSDCSERHEDQD